MSTEDIEKTEEELEEVTFQGDGKTDGDEEKRKSVDSIPKWRFDEVNNRYKKAREELDTLRKELEKAEETRLRESSDFKTLYEKTARLLEELTPKAQRVDRYEEILQAVLDSQIEEIPEDMRDLIPEELDVDQKLAWIARNKKRLTKPFAPDIGAGKKVFGKQSVKIELTPEEREVARRFNLSEEEYLKFKT